MSFLSRISDTPRCRSLLWIILVLVPLDCAAEIKFNRDILPILSDRCFFCHGPDKAKQEADLRLDAREVAVSAGAIVPGDPDRSKMIKRILTTDEEDIMPPVKSHLSLSDEEKQLMVQWIRQGAIYEKHWSLIPVDYANFAKSNDSIDSVLSELHAKTGLQLQQEADKNTLLRRVYFDLIGLPPTPDEIDAFLADNSDDAFEQVVDSLLSRPEYGERMAVHWLDLARYADSNGYQTDKDRSVWEWREWVITAFNQNLPYDEFVTWQLAGDLLPSATQEQRLATAFNRLHQYKNEGGSVPEEFRVEYVCDRVNTFGTAFLGLTMECARCHDHKYDPITQKEYFQLFAFFDDIDEFGLATYFGQSVPTPALPLSTREDEARIAALDKVAVDAQDALESAIMSYPESGIESWWASGNANLFKKSDGASFDLDSKKDASDKQRGLLFSGDEVIKTKIGSVTRHLPFSISFWMREEEYKDRAIVCHHSNHYTDSGSRGWELTSHNGHLRFLMSHFWPGNAICIETVDAVPEQEWTHVTISYDGSSKADGMRVYLNGKLVEARIIRDNLTRFITNKDSTRKGPNSEVAGISWGARNRDNGFSNGRIDDAWFYSRELHPEEVLELYQPGQSQKSSTKSYSELSVSEKDYIRFAWSLDPESGIQQKRTVLTKARESAGNARDEIKEILTMKELPEPKQAFVLNRGAYDDRGEEVFAGTPDSLPPMEADLPLNRLGLAEWLKDPDNPLFARVAVNRFWMLCFGRGLVDTAEDFGLQGERPQYPELLDFLAAEFVNDGWDIKNLMRTIVTSQTYRQDSYSSPEMMHNDPSNKLIARGPRHRLPAEMIRDNVLFASGLLVDSVEGTPKRPYDLSEAFKKLDVPMDDGLYHRSIYSLWKRSAPPPVMIAFDGAKRDVCSVRRQTTNTPLQSLVLLNGPQFIEAARAAGTRAWHDANGDTGRFIRDLSRRFISRDPDSLENDILTTLFKEQREYYTANPESATALIEVGHAKADGSIPAADLAAVTILAQALMNLDESVVKR
ncbi:MAG: DUF1553 domain-containing protein [Puniceicoccaceae bacterium]